MQIKSCVNAKNRSIAFRTAELSYILYLMGRAHGKEISFVIYDDRLNHSIRLLFFYHLQQFVEIFFVDWRTGCLIQLVQMVIQLFLFSRLV